MDLEFLKEALQLAQQRKGFCSPNPAVGCVVTQDGRMVGQGTHWAAGYPHAEVEALKEISNPKGTTVYVSLEPCCFVGRTPACTDLLVQKKVHRVVYAFRDPNPKVTGKGEAMLRANGIICEHLPLPEVDLFYQSYMFWTENKLPFVTAKLALSFNNVTASKNESRLLLTSEEANAWTHRQRKQSDAILTTVSTIIADDPRLNARLPPEIISKPIYLLDRKLRIPMDAKIFSSSEKLTLFCAEGSSSEKLKLLKARNVLCVPISNTGELSLHDVLEHIGKDGVHDLWVEAGAKLFLALHQQKLVQKSLLYVTPHWVTSPEVSILSGFSFEESQSVQWRALGRDSLCEVTW